MGRVPWTEDEVIALKEAVAKYGAGVPSSFQRAIVMCHYKYIYGAIRQPQFGPTGSQPEHDRFWRARLGRRLY